MNYAYPINLLEIAAERYNIIKSLLGGTTNFLVNQKANEYNLGIATVWRWIRKYNEEKDIRALIPKYEKKGNLITNYDTDLMEYGFQSYLKLERPSFKHAYEKMKAKAIGSEKILPSYDTFRRRIQNLAKALLLPFLCYNFILYLQTMNIQNIN